MLLQKPSFYSLLLLALLAGLSLSCGKKQAETDSSNPPVRNPQTSELDIILNKQELLCSDERGCPKFLTKIAILEYDKLRFCTGFMTENNVVATATSCLPEYLRQDGQPCDKDVFFFFQNGNEKPIRVGCKEVLKASRIEGNSAFLWRSNVSYLMMKESLSAKLPSIARKQGMKDEEKLYTWSIDQIDDRQGIIKKNDDCVSAHNTFFNPLSNNDASPVVIMGNCDFSEGNSGSPVFDYRNRVRGMVSRAVSKEAVNDAVSLRMLERPLQSLVHVSNFACAPMIPEQEVMNETECSKKLTLNLHDTAKIQMTSDAILKPLTLKLEQLMNAKSNYMKFGVKLEILGDYYETVVFPKCFKDVDNWISEFTNNKPVTSTFDVPKTLLRKSMDPYGRVRATEFVKGKNTTYFQFYPKFLRTVDPETKKRRTTVFVWSDGPTTTYRNVSDDCSESLF
jgi:hypothetical protein